MPGEDRFWTEDPLPVRWGALAAAHRVQSQLTLAERLGERVVKVSTADVRELLAKATQAPAFSETKET